MSVETDLQDAIIALQSVVDANNQFALDWTAYNTQLDSMIDAIVDSKIVPVTPEVQNLIDLLDDAYKAADYLINQKIIVLENETVNNLSAILLRLNADIRKAGSANSGLAYRLPFNHEHKTHPKYQISNTRPLTRAKSAGLFHIDTGMSDLWFSTGYDLEDWVKLDKSIGRRRFLVLEFQHYIALDAPYTGDVTIRVWPFQNGRSGLVDTTETQSLTMGSWQEITYSVTEMGELFRNDTGSVSYFYGLVDYVRFDQAFDSTDTNSSRLFAIAGNIEKTAGWVGSPLIDFTLENDGYWYSDDITNGLPDSIDSGWSYLGNNTFSCSNLSDGEVLVKAISNGESEGKTIEVALRVENIVNVLATTVSNSEDYRIYSDGTYRFVMTNEDVGLKRASAPVSCTVQVISVRIRVEQ
jgi:hypothetical protein